MYDFSTPNWRQIGDMQQEIDMLHAENALKLIQILELGQLLYETRKKEFDDVCGACWCEGYVQRSKHTQLCTEARQATEPFWKGIKT